MKFEYTLDNKRYHTLNYHYKMTFGQKVSKISLNANFTCPNIDGTKGFGGCIYCSKLNSGDFAGNKEDDLITQFESIKNVLNKKWPNTKYIGYFQANSNTYSSVDILKSKYEAILNLDDVVGLSIATRADCLNDDILDYLSDLNSRTYLTVELGLQTIHDKTAKLINRCHTLEEFVLSVKSLQERGIRVVVHIMNGLPFETKEMMLETVKYLDKLNIDGIKIHMLHILKDTAMNNLYQQTKFHILTKEEYVDIVCDQIELLNKNIVIERVTSDPNPSDLVVPNWLVKKFCVINEIDKELNRRDSYQGSKRINKKNMITSCL